jgi:acyl dehydratase
MIELPDLDTLRRQIGQEIAVSDWITISQDRIDAFAEATDDRQWIHVDPARAAVESPFRTTIAHGFLTLSLASSLVCRTLSLDRFRMAINYGLNRVRFITPVPVYSRVRGRFSPIAVEEASGGVQVTWGITFERDGADKPCCVAEWVVRYYETSP